MALLIEPYIDAIKTALEHVTTGVNAQITAINTLYAADAITVESNKKIYCGRTFSVGQSTPAIVIWPDDMPAVEPTGAYTINESPSIITWSIIVSRMSDENANRKLWRHMLAVYRAVRNSYNLAGAVDICNYAGELFDSPWGTIEENVQVLVGGHRWSIQNEEEV